MAIKIGDTLGNYQIEKYLSKEGGTSLVLLGRHTEKSDVYAAIKIHLGTDYKFQDLLRREVDILKGFYHPGIVRIYPQQINGRLTYEAKANLHGEACWYFTMEYVLGPSLDQIVNKHFIKQYSTEWIVELFYQIAVVVYYLHRSGYAHFDLKPSNILLRHPPSPNSAPSPILIDFGITTKYKGPPEVLGGSIRYSSPEVIEARARPDARMKIVPGKADVWALGAIFFELLTGRPLINYNKERHITTTIMQGELDTLRSERPELSSFLDALLGHMINRDASRRPVINRILKALEEEIAIFPPRIANG